jgi:uncharacterized protein (DUF2267 family)
MGRSQQIEVVLEVFAQCLSPDEAAALASALPTRLGGALARGHHVGSFERDEMVARVAGRAEITRAAASQLISATCTVLIDELTPEARERLRAQLPRSIAAELPAAVVPALAHTHLGHTLADGRPGSRHPISEASGDRSQSESVVRADNPHADSKLSSATGLLQEREHESLATGQEGSTRPLYRK